MIRYFAVPLVCKLFSLSSYTRRFYRILANIIGERIRISKGLNEFYISQAKEILQLLSKYQIGEKGEKILELGTGWMHFGSIVIRLFYDVKITTYDIRDNRQLSAVKKIFQEFGNMINDFVIVNALPQKYSYEMLNKIQKVKSFGELYALLGFKYIVNSQGNLDEFSSDTFDFIYSYTVLEHLDRRNAQNFIKNIYRLLKPGGYSFHHIDLGDHFAYYDPSVC